MLINLINKTEFMNVDKAKIFISYVTVKSIIYVIQRKEDIQLAIDLLVSSYYYEALEKILSVVSDTMEYVVKINV
jgi:hypothetical protein